MANLSSKTREITVAAADGAQTNLDISPAAISSKQRLLVHEIQASSDKDGSANAAVRVGFGASALPAAALAGAAGIVLSHADLAPGEFIHGYAGMGAAGEKLLLSCDAPTGGNLVILYRYEIVPA